MSGVVTLSREDAPEIIDVFCESFRDYPVMRYVLGSGGISEGRLRTLVGLFVAARVLRGEPLLGIRGPEGGLVAAATVTLPGNRPAPGEFVRLRDASWAELGAAERARYEAYSAAAGRFTVAEPHHHLNMIGVRPAHAGQGLARRLIDAVHGLAAGDPASAGVSLSTETEPNVALYRHLGYRILGRAEVADGLTTWSCFRPVPPRGIV